MTRPVTSRRARGPRLQLSETRAIWRGLLKGLLDPYRPERHYMRGPGPKYLAKHGAGPGTNAF